MREGERNWNDISLPCGEAKNGFALSVDFTNFGERASTFNYEPFIWRNAHTDFLFCEISIYVHKSNETKCLPGVFTVLSYHTIIDGIMVDSKELT